MAFPEEIEKLDEALSRQEEYLRVKDKNSAGMRNNNISKENTYA